MRPLEILLILLTALAALCLMRGQWRLAGRLLSAAAAAVTAAHWIWEGAHWQMAPAYVAVGVVCLLCWIPGKSRRLRATVGGSALLFAGASLLLCYLLPIFRLPKPTGSYAVGTKILYLKDASRVEDATKGGVPRELMVQLWYPADASDDPIARYREPRETQALSAYQTLVLTNSRMDAPVATTGSPFPVILFNHGWHGRRTNDTFLTEELASRGYVVASIDHTYNANLVAFPDGRVVHTTAPSDIDFPEYSTPQRVRAVWNRELLKQAADQEFVLNQLEAMNGTAGTPWFGRLNTKVAGAMGHSFGGAAATELCAQDPRIHGAINMDGWFFGAIQARGAGQPLLYLETSDVDPNTLPFPAKSVSGNLDVTDYADVKKSVHQFGGYLVSVLGTEHEDFTDQPLISPVRILAHRGTVPPPELETIVRAYVVAFFDKTIRGKDPAILKSDSSPYAEVKVAVWPPVQKGNVTEKVSLTTPVAARGR